MLKNQDLQVAAPSAHFQATEEVGNWESKLQVATDLGDQEKWRLGTPFSRWRVSKDLWDFFVEKVMNLLTNGEIERTKWLALWEFAPTQFQNGQELTFEEEPHCGLELGGGLRSTPEKFVIWACE